MTVVICEAGNDHLFKAPDFNWSTAWILIVLVLTHFIVAVYIGIKLKCCTWIGVAR